MILAAQPLRTLQLGLVTLWLIYIPSNLFLKLLPQVATVNGLQIDYLIPKLYLTDLLMLAILSLELISSRRRFLKDTIVEKFTNRGKIEGKIKFAIGLLIGLWLLRQVLTVSPLLSLWQISKLGLFFFFFLWLKMRLLTTDNRQHYNSANLQFLICFSLLSQSLLGFYQFFTQHSLTPYWLFGESQLHNQPLLARADFAWLDSLIGTNFGLRVLPYAMTPHPNVLAGFLAVGMLIVVSYQLSVVNTQKDKHLPVLPFSWFAIGTLTTSGIALFLTQSVSAWITLGLGILFLIFKNRLDQKILPTLCCILATLFLLTPFLLHQFALNSTNPSLLRRDLLNQTAWQMFVQNPAAGVGFHQFTAHVHEYDLENQLTNFTQPAHHAGLLFLAENGILGVLTLGILIYLLKKYFILHTHTLYSLLVLLPLLVLDHYLYTLQQGWFIFTLIFLFSSDQGKK